MIIVAVELTLTILDVLLVQSTLLINIFVHPLENHSNNTWLFTTFGLFFIIIIGI